MDYEMRNSDDDDDYSLDGDIVDDDIEDTEDVSAVADFRKSKVHTRDNHNSLERKRRNQLKNCFINLRNTLPCSKPNLKGQKPRLSRIQILKRTVEVLQQIHVDDKLQLERIAKIRARDQVVRNYSAVIERALRTKTYDSADVIHVAEKALKLMETPIEREIFPERYQAEGNPADGDDLSDGEDEEESGDSDGTVTDEDEEVVDNGGDKNEEEDGDYVDVISDTGVADREGHDRLQVENREDPDTDLLHDLTNKMESNGCDTINDGEEARVEKTDDAADLYEPRFYKTDIFTDDRWGVFNEVIDVTPLSD